MLYYVVFIAFRLLKVALRPVKTGCFINGECMDHLFYTDDAVLLAPTPGSLQELIDICNDFASANEMTYNFKKSLCTAFVPCAISNLHIPVIHLGTHILKFVDKHKYLGVFINSDSTDNADTIRLMQSLYINGNFLTRNFAACSENVKVHLVKTFCYNLYGIHL